MKKLMYYDLNLKGLFFIVYIDTVYEIMISSCRDKHTTSFTTVRAKEIPRNDPKLNSKVLFNYFEKRASNEISKRYSI